MSWDANKDRCQKVYFGEPFDAEPTREEVGRFILNKMVLTHGDGPAWSKGVPKLVEMGMRYYENQLQGGSLESIDEIRYERDKLRREVDDLRQRLSDQRTQISPERAVDRIERREASILKILCQEGSSRDESSEFVPVPVVVQRSELEYSTVVDYLKKLTRNEFGGYVQFDEQSEKARVTRPTAFEEYCQSARLEQTQIAAV